MPIPNSYPIRFSPKGLSDAFDATDAFEGACTSLQNLIFDPANPEMVTSRPGVGNPFTTFAGFSSPGFISIQISIGTRTYGMIATARNTGKDEPFCYDSATSSFVTISGVTAGNTPSSPSSTGAWTPPVMAVIGTKIIVTHPGFSGAVGNFFGVIDISTPATPAWNSANTATHLLPAVPTFVANLNNRAWYAVGNNIWYTDALDPLTMTNANQALTIGDTTAVTALSGLTVTTSTAGVVGALIVFKGFQVWQVTGDPTTSNLSLNFLSLNVGCIAPRSVVQTPIGTLFVGIDGAYTVLPTGQVRALVYDGLVESDVKVPFQNATVPSRIAGYFSKNIYRLCLDTVINGSNVTGDYWFDVNRMRWNGPHTFVYDCASQMGNYFVLSSYLIPGALFASQIIPSLTSTYNDNGTTVSVSLQSCAFPKTGTMTQKQVVECTQELASSGQSVTFNIDAIDDQFTALGSTFITTQTASKVWGSNVWGDGSIWKSSYAAPHVYNVNWSSPLVFQKIALQVRATGVLNMAIGTFFARYQECGYTNKLNA